MRAGWLLLLAGCGSDGATWSRVSVGYTHACALDEDGAVACWGENRDGEVEAPSGPFASVSSGYRSSCGLAADGALTCWGRGDEGQHAAFLTVSSGIAEYRQGMGTPYHCGVRADASAVCWGGGAAADPEDASSEIRTAPQGTFRDLSVGFAYTCGVHESGRLTCWGSNEAYFGEPPGG